MDDAARIDLIAPGVRRAAVPMAPPLGSANAYLLTGGGVAVLVDTGWVEGGDPAHLTALLERAGIAPGAVAAVVATHSHVDHVGHVPAVLRAWGAQLRMHRLESSTRAWAAAGHHDRLGRWLARHGVPDGDLDAAIGALDALAPPTLEARALADGATITVGSATWRAVHTPGHTPGHVCLYRADDGIVIGGDHLLEHLSPNISALPGQPPDPLGGYLRSLRRMARLRPTLVLPGHGEPFTDLDRLIQTQEEHHARRLRDVLETLATEPRTAYGVANALRWTSGARQFGELRGPHRFLAFGETLAHLEHLARRGDLRRVRSAGIERWAVP